MSREPRAVRDCCAVVIAAPFEELLLRYAVDYRQGFLDRARALLRLVEVPIDDARLGWVDPGGMRVLRGHVEMNPITASGWVVGTSESVERVIAALEAARVDYLRGGEFPLAIVTAARGQTVSASLGTPEELSDLIGSLAAGEGIDPWTEGDSSALWCLIGRTVRDGEEGMFRALMKRAEERYSPEGYELVERSLVPLLALGG